MYIKSILSSSYRSFVRKKALNSVNAISNVRNHSSKSGQISNENYCINLVKKYDYENYLACLLLPQNIRRSVFAIRAFNTELAMIRDMVSAHHLGLMRLQFWVDSLEKIYDRHTVAPNHPVCLELQLAKNNHNLSKMWLKRLIEARESSLEDKPYQDVKQLENYCEQSVSPVYYLSLETLNLQELNADHVASHLGKAQGILNHLRGIIFNAARQRVTVPLELLAKHGVSQESILRQNVDSKMCDLFFNLASVAHEHIEVVRDLAPGLPSKAATIFLPMHNCQNYLKRLEKENFDVFDRRVQKRNNLLPFILCFRRIF